MFLIKHGQAQPVQRPLRVPLPHLFPKPDRNNFPSLPILPTKQKTESGRKENNRCHFRVALGFSSPVFDVNPPLLFYSYFLNPYTNKRHNCCIAGTQTRSHMQPNVGKLCLKGTDHDSAHDTCLSECLSVSLCPDTFSLSLSLFPAYSVSSQTSDGSVMRINNPVGPGYNLN